MGRSWLALLEATLSSSPWSRWEPPSPPCASGIHGRRSGRHGSTRCQGLTGSSSSQTSLWPHPVAGVTTLPLSSVQLWPAGALGRRIAPDASSAPLIIMVDSDDEGDDTDDGVLGAPGMHRGMAQRGRERRARHPSGQQNAAPAPRARTTPPTQAQSPPVQQRCFVRRSLSARDGTSRKRKPSADAAALTAPGAGQGQLVPAPERLSKVRKADK